MPVKMKRRKKRNDRPHKINDEIRAQQIKLVGDNVEQGVYSLQEAKNVAEQQELDLVLVGKKADPPVCKIFNYEKYLYRLKKNNKKSKKQVVKELRFTPNTEKHDFDFKKRYAEKFLKDGNKVKAYVQFRGRQMAFKDQGKKILLTLADELQALGVAEGMPKLQGRRMTMFIKPKSNNNGDTN